MDLLVATLRPPRRLVACALLAIAAWLALTAGVAASVAWSLAVAVVALGMAAILATFVPLAGWRPDLGCLPCVAVPLIAVAVAAASVRLTPGDLTGALPGIALVAFGLFQRLAFNGTCPTR